MNEISFDPRFQLPFTAIICGVSGSGKSYFVKSLLQNMDHVFSRRPDNILWSYTSYQPLYDELRRSNVNIRFIEGIPDSFTDPDLFPSNQHNLLVLDDSMDVGSSHVELMKAFTQYRHHRNMTVLYLLQNLFNPGKFSRTISLNTNYMVLFKNPRDKAQIRILAQQMFPGRKDFFLQAYENATIEPHGYLLVDLRTECSERLRLRTGILPGEWPAVYIPKK